MGVPGACARTATRPGGCHGPGWYSGTHGFLDLDPPARCPACLINSAGPYNTLPAGSFMSHKQSQSSAPSQVGRFLTTNVGPGDVFTREDLTAEQKLFGQTAADFMRREVIPVANRLYERDWPLT